MKILHLVHNYHPSVGGSQLLIQRLSEGFVARHGDSVEVFTTNALRSPNARANEHVPSGDEWLHGVRVRRFPYWRRTLPATRVMMRTATRYGLSFRDFLEPVATGPISPRMLLATARSDADVIGCMAFPFLQMYYPQRHERVVLFGALHIRDDHVSRASLAAIGRCGAYVAFTTFERDVLIRKGIDPARLHVVGLGVEVDRFAAADGRAIRARYGIADDAPVVGFIGRQARYKGCDVLLRAMTEVWRTRPDAYLVLAGARTEFTTELEAMVAALPPVQRERVVLVHDFTDAEKPGWFAACDVFASVSTDESFGIVFVEAWACGRPVIGGRIGAVECVIRDGEDGLLVPCGDPAALAAAIRRLLDDEVLARRLAEHGHAKVRRDHDWSAVIDKVRAIYERLA